MFKKFLQRLLSVIGIYFLSYANIVASASEYKAVEDLDETTSHDQRVSTAARFLDLFEDDCIEALSGRGRGREAWGGLGLQRDGITPDGRERFHYVRSPSKTGWSIP